MRHVLWIKKHISCVTIVYCLMVSAGSVVAQDSAKVSQTNATPQANATSPAVTQPSFSSIAEIEIQARRDAQADIKGQTWFLIGCLTNLTGGLLLILLNRVLRYQDYWGNRAITLRCIPIPINVKVKRSKLEKHLPAASWGCCVWPQSR